MKFNKKKKKKQNRNKIMINWQIRDQGTDSKMQISRSWPKNLAQPELSWQLENLSFTVLCVMGSWCNLYFSSNI